jgi:esterase/lipase superfamily enzyme
MGGFVTMEALRLLALRGSDRALAKIQAVVLLAPDEDVDLFRQRMRGLEGRAPPVYVFASERDRALRASARIQGRRTRLGALTDADALEDLPVYLIDISDVESADPYRHNNVATSPLMFALIRGLDREGIQTFEDFQKGSGGIAELAVHSVQQATQVLVSPVGR